MPKKSEQLALSVMSELKLSPKELGEMLHILFYSENRQDRLKVERNLREAADGAAFIQAEKRGRK